MRQVYIEDCSIKYHDEATCHDIAPAHTMIRRDADGTYYHQTEYGEDGPFANYREALGALTSYVISVSFFGRMHLD